MKGGVKPEIRHGDPLKKLNDGKMVFLRWGAMELECSFINLKIHPYYAAV